MLYKHILDTSVHMSCALFRHVWSHQWFQHAFFSHIDTGQPVYCRKVFCDTTLYFMLQYFMMNFMILLWFYDIIMIQHGNGPGGHSLFAREHAPLKIYSISSILKYTTFYQFLRRRDRLVVRVQATKQYFHENVTWLRECKKIFSAGSWSPGRRGRSNETVFYYITG